MDMMKRIALICLMALASVACSDYNKIVKGDDIQEKFDEAQRLYKAKKFDRCIVLFEQVYQNAPRTEQGELSFFLMAKSYMEDRNYYMAGYFFGAFVQRFPYSSRNEEAFFLTAMSNVRNSPKWSLDQSETYAAIDAVQAFMDKYPNSPLLDSCNALIDQLSYKIEFKEYNKVLAYDKTQNFKAATTSADLFLATYPLSIHAEEVRYIGVCNLYLLAINSIDSKKKERIEETIQRYRNFVADFKDSPYVESLKSLLKPLQKEYEL
jgi:outer membrane protein assembly factor BamD